VITVLNFFRLLLCLSLLFLQACHQKAALNAERAVEAQKHREAASYNTQLGMAYLKQEDRPRAKQKLLTALKLAPKLPEVNAAMAYYLEKTGDIQEARAYYQKALFLAPNSGAQLNNYGAFLCRLGKYKEAEQYFLKAVKDVTYLQTAGAYENAGLCAAAIPNYPKAQYYFTKALMQDPQRKQSLYELVKIALKQNNAKEALRYLQKYPVLSLNDPALVSMAIRASKSANKPNVAAVYAQRLNELNHF